ncbi:MAG: peptidase S41, partial [Chitinophagaceae bacterium]
MIKIVWVTSLLAVTISLSAQPTRLLRQPDIYGNQVVFAYAGDLWITEKSGGEARRLTSFPGAELDPHFSPDGTQIAFSAAYGDNYDVYVMPTNGGELKRLTWHPETDRVRGWTREGKIVFSSYRTSKPSVYSGLPQLWTIGFNEGLPQLLPMISAYRGSFSSDGRFMAYEANPHTDNEWRNYRGGQNKPIAILELSNLGLTHIPSSGSWDTQPLWLGDQIYFLSDRDTAMNLYRYDVNTKAIQQLTFYADFDIKYLSGSQGTLVYEYGGDLYLFELSTGKPRKLSVSVKGDFPWMAPRWVKVSDWAKHASLSPTGQRMVLEARGEIITVPAKKGDARNITNSPGARDQYPVWSPDGKKIAWFSDRSGEYALVVADQDGLQTPREIALAKSGFYYSPVWSPDSKYLAFTDHLQQLWITDILAGTTVLVDKDTYLHPERSTDPVWSPDSKYLAYAKRLPTQYHVIMVYNKDTREAKQLTDGMSDALSPAWDAGGKYLYFLASTNYALRAGWLDMSSLERPIRRSVYLMVLKKGVPSPLRPESDEEGKADKQEEQSVKPTED